MLDLCLHSLKLLWIICQVIFIPLKITKNVENDDFYKRSLQERFPLETWIKIEFVKIEMINKLQQWFSSAMQTINCLNSTTVLNNSYFSYETPRTVS